MERKKGGLFAHVQVALSVHERLGGLGTVGTIISEVKYEEAVACLSGPKYYSTLLFLKIFAISWQLYK